MSANSPYPIHILRGLSAAADMGSFYSAIAVIIGKNSAFPCPVYPISTGVPWFNLDSSAANATRWLLIDCSSEVMP